MPSFWTDRMLKIAKEKRKNKNLALSLIEGDIRNVRAGKFDAIIAIFNAVGNLISKIR
jgi:hypothetical protein